MINDNIIENNIIDYDYNIKTCVKKDEKNLKNLCENFVDFEDYVHNKKILNNNNNNNKNNDDIEVIDEDENDKNNKEKDNNNDSKNQVNFNINNEGQIKLDLNNNNNNNSNTQDINSNDISDDIYEINEDDVPISNTKNNNNSSKIDLIKFSSIYDINNSLLNNNNKTGTFFSTLYFNYLQSAKYFKFKTLKKKINIFDICITNEQKNTQTFNSKLSTFLYMSYRNNFTNFNIKDLGNVTSDSGWGCTIRSCQMMLSKGLYEIFSNSDMNKEKLLIKIMMICSDNVLNKNDIITNLSDTKYNECFNEFDNLIENYFNKIYNFVKERIEKKNIKFSEKYLKFTAPFSILNLCKLGNCVCKFTSSNNMVKSFIEINQQLFDNKIGIVYYELGYIIKNTVYETFFEKVKDNNNDDKNIVKFNDNYYKFYKKGFIFISLRLGLSNLEDIFYDKIPKFFSIRNNIGFVGGKDKQAFYCIGCYNKNDSKKYKVIYVNPHYNQDSISKFKKFDKSYFVTYLYKLNVKKLSSSFLLGVFIKNVEDVNNFFEDVEKITKNEKFEIFHIKNIQPNDNNNNNNNFDESTTIDCFSIE